MMTTMTIRNLNPETKKKLRRLAARHGRSMEEEVRRILTHAVNQDEATGLGTFIAHQFQEIGGVVLEMPARSPVRPAPDLLDSIT
jgi:plasmid stability protein